MLRTDAERLVRRCEDAFDEYEMGLTDLRERATEALAVAAEALERISRGDHSGTAADRADVALSRVRELLPAEEGE